MDFPREPEQITSEWVSSALGTDATVGGIEQIGIGVGLLGRLYRVALSGNGVPSSVIVKLPTLDEGARMNVVEPLNFYEKEVRFYQQAAEETPVGTPRAYVADHDAASGDFVLVLEDLSGRRMEDQVAGCKGADAEKAVDAMAGLHAFWWGGRRFETMPWLPFYSDPPYPQVIAGMYKQSWPAALELFGSRLSESYRDYGERFVDLVPWFVEQASRGPFTLCHGDFRLDNVFFGTRDTDPPVTLVDWQICFRGRGAYDLGYFLSQSLATDELRACGPALLDRYEEKLAAGGVEYPAGELKHDYARTIAWCFIYPVVSAGQIEFTNERQRELVVGMLDRAVAAIEETDALALLP